RLTESETRMRILRITLLSGLGAALAIAGPGMAAAESTDSTAHTGAVTAAEQAEVAAYWTPERMKEATPLDVITVDAGDVSGEVEIADPTTVEPTDAPIRTPDFPSTGGEWTDGGEIVSTAGRV